MSADRVGIIADVAGCLSLLQGDIADLRQSVLQGYFTMILLATFPPEVTADALKTQLSAISRPGHPPLEVAVTPVANPTAVTQPVAPENIYMLTASGQDRIGFVTTVAAFCADHAINILDLATTANDGRYMMILQVDLSRCASLATVQRALHQFAQKHTIQLVLQHNDIFEATHAINMPS